MNAPACQCAAYPFPHRPHGGRCEDPGRAPSSCWDCEHGVKVADPYATGDWFHTVIECEAARCPWRAAA